MLDNNSSGQTWQPLLLLPGPPHPPSVPPPKLLHNEGLVLVSVLPSDIYVTSKVCSCFATSLRHTKAEHGGPHVSSETWEEAAGR